MPAINNTIQPLLVGLGEALFDRFPDRCILGGAPLNLAVHANALLQHAGGGSAVVTRVGSDQFGDQLVEHLKNKGLLHEYIQRDSKYSTGIVDVSLDNEGHAEYVIQEDAAWDHLRFDAALAKLAATCRAVCFGTLAQRHPAARAAVYGFLDAAPQAIRFLDVNLRKPYYTSSILEQSLCRATAVKLNEHELPLVSGMLGLETPNTHHPDRQAQVMIQSFGLDLLVLTRGALGTVLHRRGNRVEGSPVKLRRGAGSDSVGAGDACSAALVSGLLLGLGDQQIADLANRVGAYVAGMPGATPDLPEELLVEFGLRASIKASALPKSTIQPAHPGRGAAPATPTKL
ncbi:MAG: PfkB family carbohydrate kinase [Planctomycetota bacterium]